jgi:HD superfamily phosphohydrolase
MHCSRLFFENMINNSDPKYAKYMKFKKLVELAGLLHDIGHGPLSHLFEEALKLKDVEFCHELQGLKLIRRINDRIGVLDQEELEILFAMITGRPTQNMLDDPERYPPFLFQIVAEKKSGLDTDKMDYLRRDALYAGKQVPDYGAIIGSPKIGDDLELWYPGEVYGDIDNLFNNRKYMYANVYFHKNVQAANNAVLCDVLQMDFNVDDLGVYIKYDDDYIDFCARHVLKNGALRDLNAEALHKCFKCPARVKKVAKRSGDTDKDPMTFINFY